MTPQDIREKTFEKAMFGGYDMAAVQNYQEEVATELANAQKEIAVLKGKMKVLVDKIEEYRASEDAMRLAILSAQKVGKQIEDDAQARADKILSEAKNTSDRILGGLQHETANEEAKLLNAKTSCAKFLEDVRNLCLTQLEYLDGVAGSKAASAPRAAARPTASAAPAEPAPAAPAEPVPAAQPEAPAAEQPVQAEPCMQQKPCPPPPWRRSPWKLTMPRPTVQQMTPRSSITFCTTAE